MNVSRMKFKCNIYHQLIWSIKSIIIRHVRFWWNIWTNNTQEINLKWYWVKKLINSIGMLFSKSRQLSSKTSNVRNYPHFFIFSFAATEKNLFQISMAQFQRDSCELLQIIKFDFLQRGDNVCFSLLTL